ncbi:sensor histidine kinase [Terrabacter carboxydivorans]|uniref:Oxygen sensor histidine kinase NreB n=1 Tax=Terrabacter carboxydivorans TaxID=619730 RepID=A0ABP5ZPU4_9MICO
MTRRSRGIANNEPPRTVSVPKAVATFLLAGLVVLTVVAFVLALVLHATATAEAIRQALMVTNMEVTAVVGPALVDEALTPGPAQATLDRVVRQRVIGHQIVRVKIWDATGRIVYSDDASLIGTRFPLEGQERSVLDNGGASADVSDLSGAENQDEKQWGQLLEVYQVVRTPAGQRLLFETYQPYQVITDASERLWLSSLPVLLGGLSLLYFVQAPLAYRMARRLKRSQDEREGLLLATLAASDRERATIAADLHDGVVQGLTGASYSLSAAAVRSGDSKESMAQVMTDTAKDLRRWMRELRSLVVTITPPALHEHGLRRALTDLGATLELRGLRIDFDVTAADGLDETTETLVYRAAQEAVRNIVRHSDASAVTLSVTRVPAATTARCLQTLVLRVSDDGCGFDTDGSSARRRGSVGLELLDAIVTSHGGALTLESFVNQGTEVTVTVPLRLAAEQPRESSARERTYAMVSP